jgi:hypothetical protein
MGHQTFCFWRRQERRQKTKALSKLTKFDSCAIVNAVPERYRRIGLQLPSLTSMPLSCSLFQMNWYAEHQYSTALQLEATVKTTQLVEARLAVRGCLQIRKPFGIRHPYWPDKTAPNCPAFGLHPRVSKTAFLTMPAYKFQHIGN